MYFTPLNTSTSLRPRRPHTYVYAVQRERQKDTKVNKGRRQNLNLSSQSLTVGVPRADPCTGATKGISKVVVVTLPTPSTKWGVARGGGVV